MKIYTESTLVAKVKEYKKIAFLDIDLSLTSNPRIQEKTRQLLEQHNFAIVFITSRPYELTLSNKSLHISPELKRPPSQTFIGKDGKRFHVDLLENDEFRGLLDPDAMATMTGMEIYLKKKQGNYIQDTSYLPINIFSGEWRKSVLDLINRLNLKDCKPSDIETIENYDKGISDVAPLNFRIQVIFNSLDAKNECLSKINKIEKSFPLYTIDDSEPENDSYSLYLFPVNAKTLKKDAVDHIFKNVSESTSLPPLDIEVLIIGDSFPDLAMGLEGAEGSNAVFFIPGGSRLSSIFAKNEPTFAGIDVSKFSAQIKKINEGKYTYKNRLVYLGNELSNHEFGASTLDFLQNFYLR